jgi:hypothetical protein
MSMSSDRKTERRGGKRIAGPGKRIGRPPTLAETRSISLSLRITPTMSEWIEAERGDSSRNEFIAAMVFSDSRFLAWSKRNGR